MADVIYAECTNCGDAIFAVEPHLCMICGDPLCDRCYDLDSYCVECRDAQEVKE